MRSLPGEHAGVVHLRLQDEQVQQAEFGGRKEQDRREERDQWAETLEEEKDEEEAATQLSLSVD